MANPVLSTLIGAIIGYSVGGASEPGGRAEKNEKDEATTSPKDGENQ